MIDSRKPATRLGNERTGQTDSCSCSQGREGGEVGRKAPQGRDGRRRKTEELLHPLSPLLSC